jgi:DNA ligase (NAD+)
VGGETAFLLAAHFHTLAALRAAKEGSLSDIDGVGPVIGRSVHTWFAQKENREMLARLAKHLKVQKVAAPKQGPLVGQTAVITGTLPTLSREEAEARVRRAGGKVASSVSVKTSFVVAGENPGSKLITANKLGVSVIDEAGFIGKITK